jgi:hypothetical protein
MISRSSFTPSCSSSRHSLLPGMVKILLSSLKFMFSPADIAQSQEKEKEGGDALLAVDDEPAGRHAGNGPEKQHAAKVLELARAIVLPIVPHLVHLALAPSIMALPLGDYEAVGVPRDHLQQVLRMTCIAENRQ